MFGQRVNKNLVVSPPVNAQHWLHVENVVVVVVAVVVVEEPPAFRHTSCTWYFMCCVFPFFSAIASIDLLVWPCKD